VGKLTKEQQQLIAVAVGCIALMWAYYVYLLKPKNAEIERKRGEYESVRQKVEQAQAQAKRLPILQREYETLQVELTSMEKQLPTDKDFPGILRLVTREALAENLTFQSLRPLDPKKENFFEVIEFEVTMSGPLQNFVRFMSSLGQQDRIFQFERLNLNGTQGGDEMNVNASFNLKTYAYGG
jgi:type IV pilus assembly protein PilO